MNEYKHSLRLEPNEIEQRLVAYLSAFQPQNRGTLCLHRTTVQRFVAFLRQFRADRSGRTALTADRLVRWMTRESALGNTGSAAKRFQSLSRFLEALVSSGTLPANPMRQFEAQFGKHRWVAIARALKTRNPMKALDVMRVPPPLSGPLGNHARGYLDLHRAVGLRYVGVERILTELDTFLRTSDITSIQRVREASLRSWQSGMRCAASVRARKVQVAKRFFDHLVLSGTVAQNPCAAIELPRNKGSHSCFRPHIFSRQEVAAILARARDLPPTHKFKLRAQVYYTLLALLYALGLRLGETRRLRLRDVDLDQATLFVHQTKFHKSRTLPFGPRLARCLTRYLDSRRRAFAPNHNDDPLFLAFRPTFLSKGGVESTFHELIAQAGIESRGSRGPRLHDLRHTFAVHRLLRWYREGVDVQSKLALLSTFMGHVEISSTEVYLTITSELLNEANRRFHARFGGLVNTEGRS